MPTFRKEFSNAKKVTFRGRSFASKLEQSLYSILLLMEKAGSISSLVCQPHVYLTQARIHMIPDFKALDNEIGRIVFYEAKGFETDVWRIKKKLWTYYGEGPLRIYKGSTQSIRMVEEIVPKI